MRGLIKFAAERTGLYRLGRQLNRRKSLILMYHGITREEHSLEWGQVPLSQFERQMAYLKSHYSVVSLSRLREMAVSGNIEPHTAAVTFDDGYRSVFDLGYPVLKREGIPATVYVISRFVTRDRALARYIWTDYLTVLLASSNLDLIDLGWCGLGVYPLSDANNFIRARHRITEHLKSVPSAERDAFLKRLEDRYGAKIDHARFPAYQPMTWDEVRAMAGGALITIGAHTRTHPILSRIQLESLEDEILGSKADLESELGVEVVDFAYPNGRTVDFTAETVDVVRQGFRTATTTVRALNPADQDLYRLGRIGIGSDAGFDRFKALLAGLYDRKV